jgi:gluconolactonase
MKIEWAPRVVASGLGFPEGPVWVGDGLVVTDIQGQCLWRIAGGARDVLARTGGGPNGATLGPDGSLYVANNGGLNVGPKGYWYAPEQIPGRIQRVGMGGSVIDVAAGFDAPQPHRPNDLSFGPDGNLYATDPANWEHLGELMPGRVWRIDVATGSSELVAEVPSFCNGIAFGPDDRLYVAQSMAMKIVTVEADGLRDFAALPAGFPDGFCFTADGHLIVCGSMGDVIQVFDPDGELTQTIEPGEHTEPTNCCIGDGVLYVTMSGSGEVVAVDVDAEPLPLYPARGAR